MRVRKNSLRLVAVTAAVTLLTLAGVTQAQAAAGPYTALGDSYSSGVGTRTYYSDSGSCYRGPNAYPVKVAAQLGAPLTFAACSGAKVPDVLNQLGSLNASTAFVTVSVGGNDAGFADVITRCALPWPWTCTNEINNANNYIRTTLPGALDNLYNQIRSRAPGAKVVVVGYPRLFNGEECNALARISPAEQTSLNATADLLATTIGGRAAAHGFGFVDVRTAFTGHAVCDDVEWLNGLSNPVLESYHPNVAGQASGYTPLVASALSAALTQV
ncbi:SGNH/GDSL hydrolase family protein [Actinophytocola oryzae]|uniref:GDSL-like lipase/acylhydrolase family protein n=1 Tax=Actinophytocola oryzae TaxID=502181 RepID=A0A4R7VZJ7_9PSEU|nr:SGNH/GDSL hydrolase family protein [Actinophytocola oryzae]TDV55215.1 GDSL-like lipase/acylhydrolase family protein [Actinophytocola oryzae]